MHILFLMHGNIRSGANLVMLRHAIHLAPKMQVSVVFQQDWFDLGIEFVPGHEAISPMLLSEYTARQPKPVDVAVTNWWTCAYELPLIPARRYVYYRHGEERALYDTPVFDALLGLIDREAFAWIVVNQHLAKPLRRLGHRPVVLPPDVDLARFRDATPTLPPCRKALRVLVEGPLNGPFKRVIPTIDMLRSIDGIEIVHIAADGSKAGHVDHAIGAIPHDAVAGIAASCDLIVKLGDLESFGMPILEQFAAGGSAIVSAFSGHEALVQDGRNGFVVDLAAPYDAARDRLQQLLATPALLAAFRQNAQETAAAFDWAPIHQRFEHFIQHTRSATKRPQRLPIAKSFRACLQHTIGLWAASKANDH